MKPARTVLALVAVGTLVGATVGFVSGPPDPRASPAAPTEGLDLDRVAAAPSGSGPDRPVSRSGRVRLDESSLGWIDVAQEVTPNATGYLNVSLAWMDGEEDEGNRFWYAQYRGWSWPKIGSRFVGTRYTFISRVGDDRLDARVRATGEGAGTGVPDPYWSVQDHRWRVHVNTSLWELSPDSSGHDPSRHALDESGHDRPVVHLMAAFGGTDFDEVEIDVRWSGAAVNVTSGSAGDTFSYEGRDLDSSVYIQADAPRGEGAYAFSEGDLDVELVPDTGRFTSFWFQPNPGGDREGAWYERPDGSRGDAPWDRPWPGEVTRQTGTWRFHVDDHVETHGVVPILVGTRYDRARLPWETWPHVSES